jgi:hypothetical protein
MLFGSTLDKKGSTNLLKKPFIDPAKLEQSQGTDPIALGVEDSTMR